MRVELVVNGEPERWEVHPGTLLSEQLTELSCDGLVLIDDQVHDARLRLAYQAHGTTIVTRGVRAPEPVPSTLVEEPVLGPVKK